MRMITILSVILIALCGSAAAQVNVDTDNRVGKSGATPKAGGPATQGKAVEELQLEWKAKPNGSSGKSPGITSPRDPQSGLPTGKR